MRYVPNRVRAVPELPRNAHQSALDRLQRELLRLKQEHEQLLVENQELREEVTLVRLLQDFELPLDETVAEVPLLPAQALAFLKELPDTFQFSDFFHLAAVNDLSYPAAKEYLRLFLRDRYLIQKGTRIEKPFLNHRLGRASRV